MTSGVEIKEIEHKGYTAVLFKTDKYWHVLRISALKSLELEELENHAKFLFHIGNMVERLSNSVPIEEVRRMSRERNEMNKIQSQEDI